MKISQFKQSKQLVFRNGKAELITPVIDGNIEFYPIDKKRVDTIKNILDKKVNTVYGEIETIYKVMPCICSIEMDVSVDEFFGMASYPTKEFADFFGGFIDYVIEMTSAMGTNINDYAKLSSVMEKNPALADYVVSKQEKQKELYQELFKNKNNSAKRKEIFNQISKLK